MNLEDAINHPKVNVFDVSLVRGQKQVFTYRKPNESDQEYKARCDRNYAWAIRKQKSQDNPGFF